MPTAQPASTRALRRAPAVLSVVAVTLDGTGRASTPAHATKGVLVSIVGYWRSTAFPYLPDPNDYIDPGWDPAERDAVVRHLYAGGIRRVHLRARVCVICGSSAGQDDLTDGTWQWPEDLAHYVVSHLVRPDQAFVDWVLSRSAETRAG